MDLAYINFLEKAADQAWPAKERVSLDGWILRANDGVTWRTNSVLPCDDLKTVSLPDALDFVIDFYDTRDIPPAFKITVASKPLILDNELENLDFQRRMDTFVQTANISLMVGMEYNHEVRVHDDIPKDWQETYRTVGGFNDFIFKTRMSIIERIGKPRACASVVLDSKTVGIGMAVVQGSYMGLFGIYTLPKFRRQGIGLAINLALARWGEKIGARTAYLQVEKINSPALQLYSKVGFTTEYRYWYRILQGRSPEVQGC